MSNADSDTTENNIDFGSELAEARIAQNYTIEEISRQIKIPAHMISVIEESDLGALPAPTFTQGYIRTYAKFLEISEESVLEKYYQAVPHAKSTDLKPRSNLPGEASSQSPLVKVITMLLIVAGIAAVIFGSFNYYQKKAGVMDGQLDAGQQSFSGSSLDSPGASSVNIEQDARLTEDGELIVGQSDPYEKPAKTGVEQDETAETALIDGAEQEEAVAATEDIEAEADVKQAGGQGEKSTENDILEIFAENGSWMKVRDANDSRLFYNMVPVGGSKVLVGKAPFSITMGNARTTRVVINKLDVDITAYIRSNNTAIISISTDGKNIIFH